MDGLKKPLLAASVLATTWVAIAGLAAMPTAAAQEGSNAGAADSVSELEQVVVTARRTSERLQDVPVAVTVLKGDALEARGVIRMEDLNNAVPGLSVTAVNSPTTLNFVIRGLGNTNPNTGSDAAVGFYLNDVPINLQNGTNLGFFDIGDVQVLKGPQGTLFGRNTTGGAILISTNRPVDHFEAYAQGGGTFFEAGSGYQTEAMVNIPITETLAVRLAMSTQNQAGWVKNIIDPNAGPAVYDAIPLPYGVTHFNNEGYIYSKSWRISALWNVADNVENLFVYSGDNEESTGLAANPTALNPDGPIVGVAPLLGVPNPTLAYQQLQAAKSNYYWSTESVSNNPLLLNTGTVSNTTTWTSGQYTVKNIVGFRHVGEEYGQEIVGLPGEYFSYEEGTNGHDISEELQLQGKQADDRLHWVAGLFYFDEDHFVTSGPEIEFDSYGSNTHYESKSKSYSGFAQGTQMLPWVEGLSLTLGARYTVDVRKGIVARLQPTPGGDTCLFPGYTAADCVLTGQKTFSKPTYTVSLDYKWDSDSLVYFATRRGYRSGGFDDTPGDAASFKPFAPETVTDYELGLKKDWRVANVPVRTNIAIYHDDYDDIQRLVVDSTNISIQNIVNAGRAKVDGAEFELTVVPVRGLEFTYSFAYTDPIYKEFVDNGQSFAGETFANAPHNTHNVALAYTLPVSDSYGTLVMRADYHHENSHFYDDEKQTTQFGPVSTLQSPGYGLVNLDAAWKKIWGSALDVDLFVKNLNNAEVSPNGAPTYDSLGNGISFFSIPPRMYGLNVRYTFGR